MRFQRDVRKAGSPLMIEEFEGLDQKKLSITSSRFKNMWRAPSFDLYPVVLSHGASALARAREITRRMEANAGVAIMTRERHKRAVRTIRLRFQRHVPREALL